MLRGSFQAQQMLVGYTERRKDFGWLGELLRAPSEVGIISSGVEAVTCDENGSYMIGGKDCNSTNRHIQNPRIWHDLLHRFLLVHPTPSA